MGIFELVASLFGGGITGLIGSVVTRIFDFKTKKLELELEEQKARHAIELKRVDAEVMAQEWAARTRMAEVEAAGKEAVADSEAFAKSFNEPVRYSEGVDPTSAQGWLLIVLDAIRAIVRPGLTLYLCVLSTLLYVDAHRLLIQSDFPQADAVGLTNRVVNMILYLTTTCVLWWFGTRNPKKANGG